ncbi:MAG: zinc ribbon domain-containing protein [Vulcanisaeta sp.]|jgi:putative transposase|uniref:zinc ribbon domain-containing protein n=1 Tax=Vulcanisaeta sp. TaxID=2020871 RepID=UPI003D0CFD8F
MDRDRKGKDGYVPAVDVTAMGIDVGVRRFVVAFVGSRARLLNDLAVVYARQNGVSLVPLGIYDAMTRAYVVSINYPGTDKYRGVELTSNIISKTLGAIVRAMHSVQRVHNTLIGLVLEDLRQFSGYKHDLVRAKAIWDLITSRFSESVSKCPAVKVSWFWMSYRGEVIVPTRDSIPIVLVEPEYTSSTCPRCGTYLGRVRDKVVCNYCGFEGDRDVIGAINVALRGFLILMKCVREGILGVTRRLRAGSVNFICLN